MTNAPWWRGARGEWYVVVQSVLFALIAFGPRTWRGWPAWPFPTARTLELMAAGMLLAGAALMLAAFARMGSQLTSLPYPAEHGRLLRSGAYRLVRHPIYSGLILAAVGWAILQRGWLTLLYAALLFALFDLKARREEAWLAAKYPEYADYRRRVRKLIPFVY